jgi:ribosomal-protein-alanine N-acetyltransferase
VLIAAAVMEDVAEVVALERDAAEAPHWPGAMYRAIVADAGEGALRRCLLLAKQNGELAGFAVGKVVGDEAELESVAVRASARRAGAGKALCAAVAAWAWAQGAAGMELEVRTSSDGAIALYRMLGFVATGTRPGYYADPTENAVLMRLERPLA